MADAPLLKLAEPKLVQKALNQCWTFADLEREEAGFRTAQVDGRAYCVPVSSFKSDKFRNTHVTLDCSKTECRRAGGNGQHDFQPR